MKKTLSLTLLIMALGMLAASLSSQVSAQTALKREKLEFQPFSKGTIAKLVRDQLKKEYKDFYEAVGRAPSHEIATADLNADSTPEIFVHLYDEYETCDMEKGICTTNVYVFTGKGLTRVGNFPSSYEGVYVGAQTTQGIRNIGIYDYYNKRFDVYTWDKTSYKKQENE